MLSTVNRQKTVDRRLNYLKSYKRQNQNLR